MSSRMSTAIRVLVLIVLGTVADRGTADAQVASAEVAIQSLMEVWESGDVEVLDSIFHSDAVYVDMPNGREFGGIDEIKGYVQHVHSWASQVVVEVSTIRSGVDLAVAEWTMSGVQDRPIPGVVRMATDATFSIKGATVVDFVDGRMAKAVDYIQVIPLILQLGGRIELPGSAAPD